MASLILIFVLFALVVVACNVALGYTRAKAHQGGVRIPGSRKPISLRGDMIIIDGRERSLLNARAEAVADGAKETSVARVLGGTVLDPGLGTLIGALWQRPVPVLVVTGPDWSEIVAFRELGSATLAARQINEAAAPRPGPGSQPTE
jgi:hypothetical protein